VRSPSGGVQGKGRQLCCFVGRSPAAIGDATFRRIGDRGEQTAAESSAVWGVASKSTGGGEVVGAKPNDIEIADGPKRSIAATHSEISAVVCRRRSAGAFRFGFSIIGQSRHNLWCEHQAAEWRPGSRHELSAHAQWACGTPRVAVQEIPANSFLAGTPGLWANLFRWFTRESVGFADAGRQNRCLPSME
jgi:hypothetical protein